jgi:hypothetical protein
MTRAILATTLLTAAGAWASADEVWLKGGGRIVGEVMERRADAVLVDVGPGTLTLPMARVDRIVSSSSRLAEFRNRAARLNPQDVQGWLALAAWADQSDLRTQAREAWEHVVSVDPRNSAAHRALGNLWQGGRWMARDDAMRAQGLVEFEGQWITPGEREARLRLDAAEAVARRETALADARVAEAEARAREAEARAHAAEVDAVRAEEGYSDGGIPFFPYAYGGAVVVDSHACGFAHGPGPCPNVSRPRHRNPTPPPPQPQPRPDPRPDNSRAKESHRGMRPRT